MTRPADNTTAQCPNCGAPDVDLAAPVCAACGASIEQTTRPIGSSAGLAIGDRVADRFVVEGVRWALPGVTYYSARLEANPSERVLLAERNASDPDPLADAGLAKPGETNYLSANPFHTEHTLL